MIIMTKYLKPSLKNVLDVIEILSLVSSSFLHLSEGNLLNTDLRTNALIDKNSRRYRHKRPFYFS